MPKPRSMRRRYRSTRRWWAVTAVAVALVVGAGVFVATDHGASPSRALQMSASVTLERAARGWGHGGYVMMPGPGETATVEGTARQSSDRAADQRLSVRLESNEITMESAEDVTLAVPSAISGGVANFSVAWNASGP
jgi:hypothetical protein